MGLFDLFTQDKKRLQQQIQEAKDMAKKYKQEANEATKHLREVFEKNKDKQVA